MDPTTIELIRTRAMCEETRTNHAKWGCPPLAEPASLELIHASERTLGFALWPDLRRVLAEIANGGFGPGNGLIGLPGGRTDDNGNSILQLRLRLFDEKELKYPLVPICDWGCGIWSCVDCERGEILTCSEFGLTNTEFQFAAWLEQWAQGVDLWKGMFECESIELSGPLVTRFKKANGRPYGP